MAELDSDLVGYVLACNLPAEEPIMRWWARPDTRSLKVRAGDHALLIGGCEYHVDMATGVVEVRDYSDPRSMRFQRYEPDRPQPYMAPSIEDERLTP
jgi:hypothetical protein